MAKIITLAKGLTLIGEIHAESSVRLEGHFEGNGLIKGTLYIAPGAFWEGSLIAEVVMIQGVLQGDISAQRVVMLAGSQVTGTIFAPLVQIQFGAVFNGVLRMRSERKALVDTATQLPANVRQIAGA
ncbi:MAG: polymer-forming cytoskeletal protein [Gammaproteobacteria bacterium]|nr:polymer-forming cytoskeletal protein [Gammaproteobacteria bacterium]